MFYLPSVGVGAFLPSVTAHQPLFQLQEATLFSEKALTHCTLPARQKKFSFWTWQSI